MRLFVAVNLPDDVRRSIWHAAAALRDGAYPIRWVATDGLHVTIKFLGEVAAEREPDLVRAVDAASAGTGPFELSVGGFGAFPNPRRARVVWVGCEGEPRLELLQHGVEERMERLGFPLEGRPFHPHVTLGRVQRGARQRDLDGLPEALERLQMAWTVTVESVDLMRSELSRTGARYTVRHRAVLRG